MLVEVFVEEQVVVAQLVELFIDTEIKQQARRGHGARVPVLLVVMPKLRLEHLLLNVVVVGPGHHHIGREESAGGAHTGAAAILDHNFGYLLVVPELHALLFGQAHHAFHNLVHSALGVPGAQGQVGVVHQRIKRGRILRSCPEKQDGKLHQFQQARVLEKAPHVLVHTLQHVHPHHVHEQLGVGELEYRTAGRIHESVDAHLVLVGRLLEKRVETDGAAGLVALEQGPQLAHLGRNIHGFRPFENHLVRGVEPFQLVIISHLLAKPGKVFLEHVGHPVPARAHVEGEALGPKHAGPTAGPFVFFEDGDVPAGLGQRGGGRQPGKAGPDNDRPLRQTRGRNRCRRNGGVSNSSGGDGSGEGGGGRRQGQEGT